MRETLTEEGGSAVTPVETVRFQLGNHLGTASVEIDGSGNLISYEEYHPYGTTAWQAPELTTVSLKRYRYTGMERDEESGLQRHGVRYYAVWLGRWGSADPLDLMGPERFSAYLYRQHLSVPYDTDSPFREFFDYALIVFRTDPKKITKTFGKSLT
jgi:RHS repeat-associated protein